MSITPKTLELLKTTQGRASITLRNKPSILRRLPGLREVELSVPVHGTDRHVSAQNLRFTMLKIRDCLVPFSKLVAILPDRASLAKIQIRVRLFLRDQVTAGSLAKLIKNLERLVPDLNDLRDQLAASHIDVRIGATVRRTTSRFGQMVYMKRKTWLHID